MESDFSLQQQRLLEIVRQQLLPRVQASPAKCVVLAEPPERLPANVRIRRCPVALLSLAKRTASGIFLGRWPEHHLNAIRVPFIAFVLQGEVDFAIGVTRQMASGRFSAAKATGRYILEMPAFTCCVVPAGVPHADGTGLFWERPDAYAASSRVLWMHVLPTGALCHLSATSGLQQNIESYFFVPEPRFAVITGLLIDELREAGAHSEAAARSYLYALVVRIEKSLSSDRSIAVGTPAQAAMSFAGLPAAGGNVNATILQLACHYIQMHLHEALTPADIARHVSVSVPHLNRIFKAELRTSVMGYVTERRQETARTLLESTDLSIAQIGCLVGHPNASHFTHAFRRWHGLSPSAHRKQGRLLV